MTRQALSPRLAIRIFVNMLSSHPEHAEACVRDRCVGGGGEAEPESAAGLRGIDDAVIPEPGGRVVRTALRVELFAGRRLERGFVFSAPGLSLRFERIATHGREHVGGLFTAHPPALRLPPGRTDERRAGKR